ncbi:LUD domain-containing protein [Planctomycetota bacterium]|nr:LUD domain-containing protein [Planctomycetota bacterium]
MGSNQVLGESRASFLGRVREALGKDKAGAGKDVVWSESAPEVNEDIFRLCQADDDLVGRFEKEATGVGMIVSVVEKDGARDVIRGLFGKYKTKKVVKGWCDKLTNLELEGLVSEVGAELFVPAGEANFEGQYDAQIGLTDVAAALAETGTLVMESSELSRGSSLVPEVHLAVVRESDLVADMIDYWVRFKGVGNVDQPSSKVFVTGPSKTADIEGVLIKGVHGPREVEIVVVKGM